MKGFLAKMLNLKPIISIDSEGKAMAYGKSFNRRSNMKKIVKAIKEMAEEEDIWNYAIVHAQNRPRADAYAEKLEKELGLPPAFTVDVSPAVGVHNGIGVIGIGLMYR